MKYKEGDRVTTECGAAAPGRITGVRVDGKYWVAWDSDGSYGAWDEGDLIPFRGEWECAVGATENPCKQEPDPMDPIVSMLITTNLASRLGLPEPYDVGLDWDSPEYLLWILYRCDALAPKTPV